MTRANELIESVLAGNDPVNVISEGPVEIRKQLNSLCNEFKASLHIPEKKSKLAKEIVALVDKNKWLMDQISNDTYKSAKKASIG